MFMYILCNTNKSRGVVLNDTESCTEDKTRGL